MVDFLSEHIVNNLLLKIKNNPAEREFEPRVEAAVKFAFDYFPEELLGPIYNNLLWRFKKTIFLGLPKALSESPFKGQRNVKELNEEIDALLNPKPLVSRTTTAATPSSMASTAAATRSLAGASDMKSSKPHEVSPRLSAVAATEKTNSRQPTTEPSNSTQNTSHRLAIRNIIVGASGAMVLARFCFFSNPAICLAGIAGAALGASAGNYFYPNQNRKPKS